MLSSDSAKRLGHVPDLFTTLRDALAGRYAVERELGRGGMATVFLAQDLKHHRSVAIKLLDPEIARAIGAERFLREIEIAARLQHPHIIPLYDSGSAGDFLYYVMPFVEGESLRHRLEREKQLPLDEAIRIATEVAGALSYAHGHGVVHRDIKPENIMLSGGTAVVADFGIARALSASGEKGLTQTGTVIGTPQYMSPEQGTGSEIDGRSDTYSLGCVAYEMLVGEPPFTGPNVQAVIARHSLGAVPPPKIVRDTIPDHVQDAVLKALAKVPADRFLTTVEFAQAMAAPAPGGRVSTAIPGVPAAWLGVGWRRGAVIVAAVVLAAGVGTVVWQLGQGRTTGRSAAVGGGLDPRRIAVLYFQDLSRDGALAYVADGLTEGLIDEIGGVRTLKVVSRDGVAPYRSAEVSRDSIARALNVGSLIDGSAEPVGNRIRVAVRLVDGVSGADIERASFELPAAQVLAVRDSVVGEVAGLLRRRLGEEVQLQERRAGTSSVEAWTLLQRAERGRKVALELEPHDRGAARRNYQQADSLLSLAEQADPRWAEPVIMRGWIAYYQSFLDPEPHQSAARLEAAIGYANRALAMNRRDPEALHLRGRTKYLLWRREVTPDPGARARLLDEAQADVETAVEVDPTMANAWYVLSVLSYDRQDPVAAALAAERAYEADAFLRYQDANLHQLFQTHYDLEQFPNAQRWCDEGGRRFPGDRRFVECQLAMLITSWAKPDVERAWALARSVDTLAPGEGARWAGRGARMFVAGVLGRAGLPDSARKVLVAARAGQDIDPEQDLAVREAVIRVVLGDHDDAVALLKRYVVANPTHKFDLSRNLHWWWRPLRDHPGFRSVAAPKG